MTSLNRREFIAVSLAALCTHRLFAEDKPVSESDPLAQALGFKNDAAKVDTKKFPKRKGADAAKQFCDNCAFYTKIDDKTGKCTIFAAQGGIVPAKGWCNSYVVK